MNQPTDYIKQLNEKIIEVEKLKDEQWLSLEEAIFNTRQQFKPINLLKNGLKEMGSSTEIKESILSTAIGLATGYISKTVLVGTSHRPIKKAIGSILQYEITAAIAKHPATVKALANGILQLFKKKEKSTEPIPPLETIDPTIK